MVIWKVILSRHAVKDAKKLKQSGLQHQAQRLLQIIQENPFENYPSYEKLVGNLKGFYSRRINIQHRLVYQVLDNIKIVKIIRMWTYYR